MFVDARALEPGTTLKADVCIAGGGAAGITIALDLVGSGLSVVLLESGGFRREDETQRLYEGRLTGLDLRPLTAMRVRALGGTTGHWEGWCRPLLPHDFEPRDYVANSGWPIRYKELVPWYERACRTLQIGPFEWDPIARAKAMDKPLLPVSGAIEHRFYQISPPTRFGTAYRDELEAADDLKVVLRANVTDVGLDTGLDRVASFRCRTLNGGAFSVEAGRYVLALGGIENARVLLASRGQQREGVANGHDVVGRYFMEHPHYYRSVGFVHSAKTDLSFYRLGVRADIKRANGNVVMLLGAVGLAPDVARREQLLGFTAQIHREEIDADDMGALSPTATQVLVTRGSSEFLAGRLTLRCEQSPLAESRVTLTEDLDALGMPRVAVDWRIAPDDDGKVRRAMVVLARELAAAGVARVWIPGDASRFVWNVSPGGHHIGTTRMGTDQATSVVDANCRTHQVRNLYMAGSSVFATSGDSNPTLTIVALAHRLAQTLKEPA